MLLSAFLLLVRMEQAHLTATLCYLGGNRFFHVPELSEDFSGHGGGDNRMVEEFLDIISGEKSESTYITSLDRSLQSHYCALAAEYSRLHDGKPVDIETFR